MSLAASILFDANYLEPALLTAFELRKRTNLFHHTYLVLLHDNDFDEAVGIVQGFCNRFNESRNFFVPISLKNTLPKFDACHFNNSIIYKAIIPSLLPNESYILNLDAGMLLGGNFDSYIRDFEDRYCHEGAGDWIVAADCHDPEGRIPAPLSELPHANLYPAGIFLLFNGSQYTKRNWYARFLQNYISFHSNLTYAEQELMCLTAIDGEILELPRGGRITPFLGLEPLLQPSNVVFDSDDFVYFKFVGSLKPWKYWVLDPTKAAWTRRRALLEEEFPLSQYTLINRNRHAVNHEGLRRAFLETYDKSLLADTCNAQ